MKEKFPTSFVVVIILLLVIIGFFYWFVSTSKENKTESSVDLPVAESHEESSFHSQVDSRGVHKPPKGWSIDGKGGGSMTPGPKGVPPGSKSK